MAKDIKVAELFAGVGGFRLGLEGWKGLSALSNYKTALDTGFKVVWSNQWEPGTKSQDASKVYELRFGANGHTNQDIATVPVKDIPDHDMLVGGFPCQDYSVARTLSRSGGLQGKKGVLWWEIYRILKEKAEAGHPVKYLFLENVDRLLKSPVKQRGRDMAIILASLADIGYAVEWRIINAAEYGLPQRRRRVFILGYHQTTPIYNDIDTSADWLTENGIMAQAFPVNDEVVRSNSFHIKGDLADLSEDVSGMFKADSPFENAGYMKNRNVVTKKVTPLYAGKKITLGNVLLSKEEVDDSFYIDSTNLQKWEYLKGAKSEVRTNKGSGFTYKYAEGGMVFPDPLDQPSRTIITGEGGAAASRFKHVIKTVDGRLRRLTPVELERLNMFPDEHTNGASVVKRAFFMGNALVVGVIEKVGQQLLKTIAHKK